MKCKVSIGIPFFNSERTLADAIRSVFAQTFADWELLLMDDGSGDGSLALAQRVRDPRVHVISDGVHKGLPTRLNEIAALARGKYFARMDSDDLMHPERLQRQVEFLDQNPGVDLLGAAVCTIDHANNPVGIRDDEPLDTRPASVLKRALFVHPTVIGPLRWFRENPYDPAFERSQDREMWCRVCRTAILRNLLQPLLFYREAAPINLGNYLRSGRTSRLIFRKYGPAFVGRPGTALLLVKSHLKCLAYRMGTLLGLQKWLVSKRYRPLAAQEEDEARSVIGRILRTPVPGLVEGASALATCV